MKKYFIITALFVFYFLPNLAQNLKALDEKNGFREYKFGMDVSEFENLSLIDSSDNKLNKYYIKTDDKLSIGEYEVKQIVYAFYKNKLSTISIKTEGFTKSRGVLKTFQELYGKGYKSNTYMDDYIWNAKSVIVSYDENSISNDASILMWSKPINKQEEADKKNAVKNAANDL